MFGVVREPVRAMISQVNCILTRIFAAEKEPDPDTLGWRRLFQVNNFDQAISKTAAIELAGRVLRRQGVVPANVACRFLGGATADAALERAICYDVELTDTAHLNQWCKAKWGIDRQTRSNVSRPYIALDDLRTPTVSISLPLRQRMPGSTRRSRSAWRDWALYVSVRGLQAGIRHYHRAFT